MEAPPAGEGGATGGRGAARWRRREGCAWEGKAAAGAKVQDGF